jgi:2-oxoglutarate/2-oxoacid ferredoxin oxidoreductase subunit beta
MTNQLSRDQSIRKYLREEALPTIWCAGCGIGTVVGAMLRAIDSLALDPDRVVIATGIGCSGFMYNYLNFDSFHGTHGRALPAATGVKIAKPELTVVVPMGDGDALAIGGNHFIHAARRNIDLTAIVINNQTYGMTGGQYSPSTPRHSRAATAPLRHIERPFDVCELARAAGATYLARGVTSQPRQLADLIARAIDHRGFSVVEAVSQCPVQFGRRNDLRSADEMLRWQKEHAITVRAASRLSPEQLADRVVTGELLKIESPEWTDEYARLIAEAQEGPENGR